MTSPSNIELTQIQSNHLHILERLGNKLPEWRGVGVVKVLNYELVQILNNLWLEERLRNEPSDQAPVVNDETRDSLGEFVPMIEEPTIKRL